MKITKKEKITRFLLSLIRKNKFLNECEDMLLADDFSNRCDEIYEENRKHLMGAYYMPKAVNQALKEDGFFIGIEQRAQRMFLEDLHQGKIDALCKLI